MESPEALTLEDMAFLLEQEAQLYENKTAEQYLASLEQYLNSVTLTHLHSKEDTDYDTDAGVAWVVTVPTIYFSSVLLVMVILLLFLKHSETHMVKATHEEVDAVDVALSNGSGVERENTHEHEHAVVVDCNGASSTSKGAVFLRGYVNAAGEVEGASRASGASKGSVRSLGVLTDPHDGGICRPHLNAFHPNPPSAPSALTRHGMTTFELLARRRLSRSIDELRDEARPVAVQGEWSGLGAIGGRTSLEMNVTSGGPQLTLLGSDLAAQDLPPEKRCSNSIDSLDDNLSRDSLRASMELHKDSGSGLRPDDLYGLQERNLGPGAQGIQLTNKFCLRRGSSFSSSSLGSASRSNGRLGNVNFSFVNSDNESAYSKTGSNTYTDIISFTRANQGKSDENDKFVTQSREKGLGNRLQQLQTPGNAADGTSSGQNIKTTNTVGTITHTVGSNTADISIIGRHTTWSRHRDANCPPLQSQAVGSWSSVSDIAAASRRSLSPSQRGRPLSLDMLTSWPEDMERKARRETDNVVKKQVPRQLFATTPQMSRKTGNDFAFVMNSASKSAPARHADSCPFNIKLKSFDISLENQSFQNAGRRARCLPDYSSSNSNTQESSVYPQENTTPSNWSITRVTSQYNHQPYVSKIPYNGGNFHQKQEETHAQSRDAIVRLTTLPKNSEHHVNLPARFAHIVSPKDHVDHGNQKSSFSEYGEANHTVTSDLSTAASVWTSPESIERQKADLEHTESSANSTIDSISSSLAP